VAALRSSLDRRKGGLAAVFAGSSVERLRAMFSAKDAPFFRFATPVELPPLEISFVDHQLKAFRATSKSKVEREDAVVVFERFERNPMFFQRWLTTLALNPNMSGKQAIELVQLEVAEELGFAARWAALAPIQRAVARLIADRTDGLFGRKGAAALAALTKEDAPPPQRVQAALRRLLRLGVADKRDNEWRMSDPLFETWVRSRPKTDF
jgi:hypothetical protein